MRNQLIRGVIDLLSEAEDELLIIDYKTTIEAIAPLYREQPEQLAADKGYHKQLYAYIKGMELLYPEKKIEAGIYFTKTNYLVTLAAIEKKLKSKKPRTKPGQQLLW